MCLLYTSITDSIINNNNNNNNIHSRPGMGWKERQSVYGPGKYTRTERYGTKQDFDGNILPSGNPSQRRTARELMEWIGTQLSVNS